jgi:hypothetical protein
VPRLKCGYYRKFSAKAYRVRSQHLYYRDAKRLKLRLNIGSNNFKNVHRCRIAAQIAYCFGWFPEQCSVGFRGCQRLVPYKLLASNWLIQSRRFLRER